MPVAVNQDPVTRAHARKADGRFLFRIQLYQLHPVKAYQRGKAHKRLYYKQIDKVCVSQARPKLPMSEELEKLRHKQYVAERKLTVAKHKEKRLQSELKRLTRSERTHRLCTRAGMLETFLKEPTVLTDEDVMELLTFIFQSEAVQKELNRLIESRRETQEADEGENP